MYGDIFIYEDSYYAIAFITSLPPYTYSLTYLPLQMLRAFTNVAVKLLNVMFDSHMKKFLLHEQIIVFLTLTGIAITSFGETHFILTGFMYQLLSNTTEAIKIFLMESSMKELKIDHLSLLYYTTPLCFIVMAIACLMIEVPLMTDIQIASLTTTTITTMSTTVGSMSWILALNGCISFSVDVIFIYLVKHTTTLTRSLSLGFKNIYLISLSVIVFDTPVTILQYVGYGVTLIAIISQYNLRLIEAIMVTFQLPINTTATATTTSTATTTATATSFWSSFTSFLRIAYNTITVYSSSCSTSTGTDEDEGRILSYSKILANSKEEKFESKQSQVFLI